MKLKQPINLNGRSSKYRHTAAWILVSEICMTQVRWFKWESIESPRTGLGYEPQGSLFYFFGASTSTTYTFIADYIRLKKTPLHTDLKVSRSTSVACDHGNNAKNAMHWRWTDCPYGAYVRSQELGIIYRVSDPKSEIIAPVLRVHKWKFLIAIHPAILYVARPETLAWGHHQQSLQIASWCGA